MTPREDELTNSYDKDLSTGVSNQVRWITEKDSELAEYANQETKFGRI
jgi:hypothetical protein